MTEAVATYEHGPMQRQEPMELTVEEIVSKVAKVRLVAESVMKKDIHFGTIPGTAKPTLYKAGGEILALTFRLAPRYEGERESIDLGNGHREYVIRCELFHIGNGAFFGAGLGSCSTMESKYRFRPGPVKPTGLPVPGAYWNVRKSDPAKAQELIGGKGFSVSKIDGKWEIVEKGETVENPNPADQYNTCLKMASKRSYIDAILKATAASEVYTQDLEEMAENEAARNSGPVHVAEERQNQEPAPAPHEQPPPAKDADAITEKQRARMCAIWRKTGFSDAQAKRILAACGFEHTADVTRGVYQKICEALEMGTPEQTELIAASLGKWLHEA